jgi:hypothetical protein
MDEQQMMELILKQSGMIEKQVAMVQSMMSNDMHTKAPAAFATAQRIHGQGGLFNTPGLSNEIISTHVKPRGLGPRMQAFPSFDTNPRFGFLTGISDDVGSEPVNVCDDAPTGYLLGGILTAKFGRLIRSTETMDYGDLLLKLNRGDMTDLQLYGALLNEPVDGNGMMPSGLGDGSDALNTITKAQMVMVGARMERKLAKMLWNGSTGAGNGGGYIEFPGLLEQIRTGHVDAIDNIALPSADSLVIDAAYSPIGTYDIVGAISAAEYYVHQLALDTVDQAEWVFVMRSQMWHQITELWPCAYNTGACAGSLAGDAAGRVIIDGRENITERDKMRSEMKLTVNGRTYEVVTDDGLYQETFADNPGDLTDGQLASTIAFVPMTIGGNLPATYWQYVDFRAANADLALLQGNERFWSDGGRFLWGYEDTGAWCYRLKARTEPRAILRSPQFAFRIDNVVIEPTHILRGFDPSQADWVGGGISLRSAPSDFAAWL